MNNFLTRLRERQVIKTLLLYVAIGWGFYEIASEVLTRFGFADTWITLLLVFLLLGFPAALFLAWYFDIDRRGLHEEAPVRRGDWAIIVASLLLPVVGVIIAKPFVDDTAATAGIEDNTVAVLPFSNFTGDASLEYIGDGVAEEIIASLTALPELNVSALTQSFRFRGSDVDVQAAGRDLDVAWLVRGSVRSSSQLLRFSASVIDTRTGESVWSQSTDVSKLAIFQGQDELSRAVAAALSSEIGIEAPVLAETDAPDPEAYDLYLRGRHIWHRRGTVELSPGVAMLAEATRIDPDFAKGWAALGSAYLTWPSYSPDGYATWLSSEDVALKAIELDPRLPEPYAVLATHAQQRQDWVQAHEFYEESLRLDNKNATAHFWYGEHLASTARYGDSVRHMLRAIELDPTYEAPKAELPFAYLTYGAIDLGAGEFRRSWDAGFQSPMNWLGNFVGLIASNQYDEAAGWAAGSPLPDTGKELLARFIAAQAGGDDDALVDDIINNTDGGLDYRLKIWLVSRLGDYDAAMDYIHWRLDNGYMLDTRPLWGAGIVLHEHERFPALMERLNLVEYWQQVEWGDMCRLIDEDMVCDSYRLNPDDLQRILSGDSP